MKNVIAHMRTLCPLSDETVRELENRVTLCRFPKNIGSFGKIRMPNTPILSKKA